MSQFTAPAGILGRPDFSGENYELQAFQNLSNTLNQLAQFQAKNEVEQAYEYGLMVEQLGEEEARNASAFGQLVDQGRVSNLANSWIEVGGQVGRAKKDFISWSAMAEENMNLSLDSDQFGLRNGDNSEQAYTDWKATVFADQRQKINGAGYYYGKTFGGLMDKWESEFKPKFLETRAALQRDDLRRGVADEITDLVRKKADDLPGLMSSLTMLVSDAGNRGALGNEGYRKYTYDVLEQLAQNPDTAVAANYALENMREESGLKWADHYAEELNASENKRDAASLPKLTEDAKDDIYLATQKNREDGEIVNFTQLTADMSHLPEEAQHAALSEALQQAADDFVTNGNPEGMEVLLDQFEDTVSPTGEPYSEVMGTEIARIRNYLDKGEEDALQKKILRQQYERREAETLYKGVLAEVATELEAAGAAVDISKLEFRTLVQDRLKQYAETDPRYAPFFEKGTIYHSYEGEMATGAVGIFTSTLENLGEDQGEASAEILQQIIQDNPTDVAAARTQLATLSIGLSAQSLAVLQRRVDDYYKAMAQVTGDAKASHDQKLMKALDTEFGFKALLEGDTGFGTGEGMTSQSQMDAAQRYLDELETEYEQIISAKIADFQTRNPGEPLSAEIMETFATQASEEVIEAATADGAFTYESPQSMIERIKAAGEERVFEGRELPDEGAEIGGGIIAQNMQGHIDDLDMAIKNNDRAAARDAYFEIKQDAAAVVSDVHPGKLGIPRKPTSQQRSAYPIARLFNPYIHISIEELESGTFDTNGGVDDISLTRFNYDPRVQPMFESMDDLRAAYDEYREVGEAGGDINTTRVVRLVNTINKRASEDDLITGVQSIEAFVGFQKDLLEFRGNK